MSFFVVFWRFICMKHTNSFVKTDLFFKQYNSLFELNMLKDKVRSFFKTLDDVDYTVCQLESELDINEPKAEYLICTVGFHDGNCKDYCFKVVGKNMVKRAF